ncbi:MAG: GAF domain-containing protein, partial [Pseudomonadota bacterium]
MATINFKRLVGNLALKVLEDLYRAVGEKAGFRDASDRLVWGDGEARGDDYPVELDGKEIGWVRGGPRARVYATILTALALAEAEKKDAQRGRLDNEEELSLVKEFSERITHTPDLGDICLIIVDEVTRSIQATGASVMLVNEETGNLEVIAGFGKKFDEKDRPTLKAGVGIVGDVMVSGNAEIVNDAKSDPRYVPGAREVASLICVPILARRRCIGAINVSSEKAVRYEDADIKLVAALAAQAAPALENARKYEKILKQQSLGTVTLLHPILNRCLAREGGGAPVSGDAGCDPVALFSMNIRHFGDHAKAMSPQQALAFLDGYFEAVLPAVRERGGFLTYPGTDFFLAFFDEEAGGVHRAVEAAIDARKRAGAYSDKRRRGGNMEVTTEAAVHYGTAGLGVLSSDGGPRVVSMGDCVWVAARFCRLCRLYGAAILITDEARRRLHELDFPVRELDMVQYGEREPALTVYELFGSDPEGIRKEKDQTRKRLAEAIQLYRHRSFAEAARIFDDLRRFMPFDRTLDLYHKR